MNKKDRIDYVLSRANEVETYYAYTDAKESDFEMWASLQMDYLNKNNEKENIEALKLAAFRSYNKWKGEVKFNDAKECGVYKEKNGSNYGRVFRIGYYYNSDVNHVYNHDDNQIKCGSFYFKDLNGIVLDA